MNDDVDKDAYDNYVKDILPGKCGVGNEDGVEPTNVIKLYEVIKPIFEEAEKNDECLQCVLSTNYEKNHSNMRDNVETWFRLLDEAKKSPQVVKDEKIAQIVHLMNYMVTCESLYTYMVDWFCFLVMKARIEGSHIPGNQPSDMNDIQSQPLNRKLDLLKKNKLGEFAKACRPEVRNAIAHFSFVMHNDQVCLRNGDSVDIEREYRTIRDKALEARMAVEVYYDLKFGTPKQNKRFRELDDHEKKLLSEIHYEILEKTPNERREIIRAAMHGMISCGLEKEFPVAHIPNVGAGQRCHNGHIRS